MPVVTSCTECGTKMRVSDNAIGKQIKCPKCNLVFTATAAAGSAAGTTKPATQPSTTAGTAKPTAAPTSPAQEPSVFTDIDAPAESPAAPDQGAPRRPEDRPRGRPTTLGDLLTFRAFITPMVIQVVFWFGLLGSLVAAGTALYVALLALDQNSPLGLPLVVLSILALVLAPIVVRIWCEALIVFFRILDTLQEIKDQGGQR
jgi:predicted Zn finger-like uncharacterized protein